MKCYTKMEKKIKYKKLLGEQEFYSLDRENIMYACMKENCFLLNFRFTGYIYFDLV
jgi:hypothetical protein